MVRILLVSRGLRPWFHSTTDHPYLDPAGACGKGISFFQNYKAFFKEKENLEQQNIQFSHSFLSQNLKYRNKYLSKTELFTSNFSNIIKQINHNVKLHNLHIQLFFP